jgi:GTP-binding protein HflX
VDEESRIALENMADRSDDVMVLSALEGTGMDQLLELVSDRLEGGRWEETLSLTFAQGKERAWLFQRGVVLEETQTETGYDIDVRWSAKDAKRFREI